MSVSHDFESLLYDSARKTMDRAAAHIGNNPQLFDALVQFALKDKEKMAMRSARVVSLLAEEFPDLFIKHIPIVIKAMPQMKNDGLKRSMAKVFAENDWPVDEDHLGLLADVSFQWLNSSDEKVALKVYASDIIYKISNSYPEIKRELISSLENLMTEASPAVRSRGRKMLKKLYGELDNS